MTGYASKRAAAQDKLAQEPLQYSFKAYWAEDGRIGVVACIIRPDGGPHIMEEFIDPPQPAQEPWRESASDYERGVIDGRQMQAQSSVDKAVNAMTQRPWVDLTDEEIEALIIGTLSADTNPAQTRPRDIKFARSVLATFKEKNK